MTAPVICPGCGAEIDPETGKAKFDGEAVTPPGDAQLAEENEALRAELLEVRDELARLRTGKALPQDDGDNPFFRRG